MSARNLILPDPATSYRAVENLIAQYAQLVDDGDFSGLGNLLADATFIGSRGPVSGRDAIKKFFEDTVIVYADGTPHTHHVTTNVAIEVTEETGTASSRSYVTVFQALPDLPLQPIGCGRYEDSFQRRDGRWRFVERRVRITHVGDASRHLKQTAAQH
ncbi:nuclear transport factor 2 family protein [Streptomyces sp. NBC_01549]|uniref:nuclear transport factor 2 family protein n=1 Tax=Streptomyces sp. NBC_01549 TaxID=2975874 RepID=UPI00224F2172|nr:nuclear transport factor 2 family protein [Streptomyces sp. NBC_01549]MCX4596750.1 nuclear transport factor 2 family protein [Streptomyces sp. NBC_01549]